MKYSIALFVTSVAAVTVIDPPVFQSSGLPSGLLSSGLLSNPVQPTASDDTSAHVPTFTLLPPSNPAGTSKPSVITDPAPTTVTGTNGGPTTSQPSVITDPAPTTLTGTNTPSPTGSESSGSGTETGSPSTSPSTAGAVSTAAVNLAAGLVAAGLAVAL